MCFFHFKIFLRGSTRVRDASVSNKRQNYRTKRAQFFVEIHVNVEQFLSKKMSTSIFLIFTNKKIIKITEKFCFKVREKTLNLINRNENVKRPKSLVLLKLYLSDKH